MKKRDPNYIKNLHLIALCFAVLLFIGCRQDDLPATAVSPESAAQPPSTLQSTQVPTAVVPTSIPPTPTPTEPLAAVVNGQQIFLSSYERLVTRFEASNPDSSIDYGALSLDALIDNMLITQAAERSGVAVSEAQIDEEMRLLIDAAGGQENFEAWLNSNFYTVEEMRQEVRFGLLSAPVLADVTAAVPATSEQVHGRYIKVADETLANSLYSQLQNGADFITLANQNSIPELTSANPNGGDIGFFGVDWPLEGVPPTFAETAFTLAPGQVSQPFSAVESDGITYFYIVQAVAKEIRPLPQQLLDQRRQEAIVAWIQSLRQNADITIMVETGSS